MNMVWVEVSKSALVHNVRQLRKRLNGSKLMAVVKSNAYGHGFIETSKIFLKAGVDWLGVNSLDEAIELRAVGIKAPVLILASITRDMVPRAIENDIRFFVSDLDNINRRWKKKPIVHIKIDTGMSRQGIFMKDVSKFIKNVKKYAVVEGIVTHFANADELEDRKYFNFQLMNFKKVIKSVEKENIEIPMKHAFNTPAFLTSRDNIFDLARIGIGLYGLWPSHKFKKQFKKIKFKTGIRMED